MSLHTSASSQRDIITGERKQYKRELRKMGKDMAMGEWVAVAKAWDLVDPDDPSRDRSSSGEYDGVISFQRLQNGNLKATLEYQRGANEEIPHRTEYVLALDPYTGTFQGVGVTPGSWEEGASATGFYDRREGVISFTQYGPTSGEIEGMSMIATWGFVNVGGSPLNPF